MTQTFQKNIVQNDRFESTSPGRSVDERIHNLFKTMKPTEPLWNFICHLKEREENKFRQLVYTSHTEALERAVDTLDLRIAKEKSRRDEFESAFEYICVILKDSAHYPVRISLSASDTKESLVLLIEMIENIMSTHKDLTTRLRLLDDSPGWAETRRLSGILHRTNYYLEYKKTEVEILSG